MFDDNHDDDDRRIDPNNHDDDKLPSWVLASSPTEPSMEAEEQVPAEVQRYRFKLGDHDWRPDFDDATLDAIEQYADVKEALGQTDAADQFRHAAQSARRARMHDFECHRCGLTHGHDDVKHDLRSIFNVRPMFVETTMEWNPACHCGVNELALAVDYYHLIPRQMFADEDSLDREEREHRFDLIRRAASAAVVPPWVRDALKESRDALEAYEDSLAGDDYDDYDDY